jgi:endoglucanase
MNDLLEKLTKCYGPSGNEEQIRNIIIDEIKSYCDEVKIDILGNLIVRKKSNGKKVMLASHMDEVGIIITFIDDKGFLRFSNIGGILPHHSLYQKVVFANGVQGAVCYEEKIENMKDLKFSKMYIDIGASTKKEAEKVVSIGDAAAFVSNYTVNNKRVITKSLDNRIGCFILINLLKELQESPNDLYYVFTVQEELGLRGAKTSSYAIDPDYAISVDVTGTGDKPECKTMAVELGKGPAIKIKDISLITHPYIKNIMINTAIENNIPYQLEVLEYGGTDSGAIHTNKGGIPSGVLSVPSRYIHSTCEMIDFDDVNNSIKLLKNILSKKFI